MRRRALLTAALALSLSLGGCGRQAPADDGIVELRFSWWGGNGVHRAQLEAIEAFERRHPDIRVSAEYSGWTGYLERMATQIAGNTAPDLMQINWNWLMLFSRDGTGFYDLNTLADVIDLPAFSQDAVEMATIDGRLDALPPAMTARQFWYNRTTWDRAGLPLPQSWDDLFAAGAIFRERLGPDYYPLNLNFQDVIAMSYSWYVQQHDRPLIAPDAPQLLASRDDLVEMAAFYQRLVDAHVIPDARTVASYGHLERQELRPWIDGRWAGMFEWNSAIGKSANALAAGQTLVLGPYPMLPQAKASGLIVKPGQMWAINAHSEHPREAAMLMNFMLNDPEAVRILGTVRGVPDSRTARELLLADGVLEGLSWSGTQQAATLPGGIRLSGWYEHFRVRDGFTDIFERLGYGVIDAEEAGAEMDDDINRILRRIVR